MAKSLETLQQRGLAHRRFDAHSLRARFPQIRFGDAEAGFIEEESGALIARRGVQAVAADAGLKVIHAEAGAPTSLRNGRLRVAGLETAAIVYACGPWLGKLFPDHLAGRIVATRQEVMHFGPPAGSDLYSAPRLPVWADFNAGDIVYGLPDLEGQGFKLAFDAHGEVVDPDTLDRRVRAETVERARSYLARRFPALAAAPLVHSRVCQYENTSNGDFLIDRLAGFETVWLVGGGSGHGFKHGPEVGRRAAQHVLDPSLAVEPRFSLATKEAVRKRTVF
jgi:glycine/D-amino acid oxidase-like deaminating enzyme